MGTLHTYEFEIEPIDYPEHITRTATIIVKYWYTPGEREWFNPAKGEGSPGTDPEVEIHTAFIEGINGQRKPLREYPELYSEIINQDLEFRIAEEHDDSPGDR